MRKTIVSDDVQLSVDDVGEGVPVVLVHGLACGKRMWFHQVRALRARFRVVTYDQRGHGFSDAPADSGAYSPQLLAGDLLNVLDGLAIERAHIVGFSLGGGPALGLASMAPSRVVKLILADVGAGADNTWKSEWLAQRWTKLIQKNDIDELVCDMLRSEFFKRFAQAGTRHQNYMAQLIRSTPLQGLQHTLSEIIAKRKSLFRMSSVLKSIQVPTLVLLGNHDNVCRASARLLSENIPGAQLRWVSGAGHMCPLEKPSDFNSEVLSFLAG